MDDGGVADVLGVGFALHGSIRITKWLQLFLFIFAQTV